MYMYKTFTLYKGYGQKTVHSAIRTVRPTTVLT